MAQVPTSKPHDTWIMVDAVIGTLQADIVAGLLRSHGIPVYIDLDNAGSLFPSSAFGSLIGKASIFVPESYYEMALALLAEENEPPALDEPGIKL